MQDRIPDALSEMHTISTRINRSGSMPIDIYAVFPDPSLPLKASRTYEIKEVARAIFHIMTRWKRVSLQVASACDESTDKLFEPIRCAHYFGTLFSSAAEIEMPYIEYLEVKGTDINAECGMNRHGLLQPRQNVICPRLEKLLIRGLSVQIISAAITELDITDDIPLIALLRLLHTTKSSIRDFRWTMGKLYRRDSVRIDHVIELERLHTLEIRNYHPEPLLAITAPNLLKLVVCQMSSEQMMTWPHINRLNANNSIRVLDIRGMDVRSNDILAAARGLTALTRLDILLGRESRAPLFKEIKKALENRELRKLKRILVNGEMAEQEKYEWRQMRCDPRCRIELKEVDENIE